MSVDRGIERWRNCFEAVDAEGCAACYEADAALIAEPFGTFRGREAIAEFWADLTGDGYNDLSFVHRELVVIDDTTARCKGVWTMSKAYGRLIHRIWTLQPDGTALMSQDHFEVLGSIKGGPPERAAIEAILSRDML